MVFKPTQILFAPTFECNLKCAPCPQEQIKTRINIAVARSFLKQCRKQGIKEIGFTGGEPFLYPGFLAALSRQAAKLCFRFDRIMTNATWFVNDKELVRRMKEVLAAGFTGTFCLSVDDYHRASLAKVALFVRRAVELTGWTQCISLVYIDNIGKIRRLAKLLGGEIAKSGRLVIKPREDFVGLSAKISKIDLCPTGKAIHLADPWGKKWFKEDFCRGPGQVLYVGPNGAVKPCCGFAADLPAMIIGNIYQDTARAIIKRANSDPFLRLVYKRGLLALRDIYLRHKPEDRLTPTLDRCFFCWYVQMRGIREYI